MNITEKAAYLKGLAKGLDVNNDTKEGKLLLAMVDAFEYMATELADVKEACEELDDAVDMLDEDLSLLEDDIWGDDDVVHDDDDEDEDDLSDLYEIICPACGDHLYLDEGMLEEGTMDCPNCKGLLEFETKCEDESKEIK